MSITTNKAIHDVCEELHRQQSVEGYSEAHDDEHAWELASAGSAYALLAADQLCPESQSDGSYEDTPPTMWPEGWEWKPKDPRANLVRAAALLVAQIAQMDRVAS